MAKRKCEICGENPATVPDRDRPGSMINRICQRCHSLRLVGDVRKIFELQRQHRLTTASTMTAAPVGLGDAEHPEGGRQHLSGSDTMTRLDWYGYYEGSWQSAPLPAGEPPRKEP